MTLSTALCLPMSSRKTSSSPPRLKSAAACRPPVRPKDILRCAQSRDGSWHSISGSNSEAAAGRRKPRRRSCAIEALPHTPQADPAENLACSATRLDAHARIECPHVRRFSPPRYRLASAMPADPLVGR